MDRKLIIYGVLLALIIGLIILIDSGRPKPVNWTPTYAAGDKIPFGLYVLNNEAKSFFKGQPIKRIATTPYEYFDKQYNYETKQYNAKGTFINISETDEDLDQVSVKELVSFASHGNSVFLSMKQFPKKLLDTLGIDTPASFFYKDSIALTTTKAEGAKYYFTEGISFTHFNLDSTAVKPTTLGYQQIDTIKQANFIKVPYGKGSFILHSQPAVFSNFHLLKRDHYKYAEEVLGMLPKGTIYWYFTDSARSETSSSPLRYILSQPALRWAYYLALISLFIFMFFNAKRKQRIIPEIEPLKNTTVDFAKTIGNLYYQEGDHHTIIDKKIIYFLEKLRKEYLIDTYSLDEDFIEKLHAKSGRNKDDIQKAVQLIKKHRHQFESSEADVIEINKAIEKLRL